MALSARDAPELADRAGTGLSGGGRQVGVVFVVVVLVVLGRRLRLPSLSAHGNQRNWRGCGAAGTPLACASRVPLRSCTTHALGTCKLTAFHLAGHLGTRQPVGGLRGYGAAGSALHGMQKVRGSNPLSSTPGQRPVPNAGAGLFCSGTAAKYSSRSVARPRLGDRGEGGRTCHKSSEAGFLPIPRPTQNSWSTRQ